MSPLFARRLIFEPLPAIMKKTFCILFSLISWASFGQEYPRIDTLFYGTNVDHIRHYLHYNDKEEMLVETNWFDDAGKHIFTYYGYDNESQSRTSFEYDKGYLTSVKRTDYRSPHNDSIGQLLHEETMDYLRKGLDIDWDLINEKYDKLYEKVNPENVNWISNQDLHPSLLIKRNIYGQDSLIELYSELSDNEFYLDEIITFDYNEQNKLVKKKWTDVPHESVFKFQAFKPSSNEFEDSIKVLSGSYREKIFRHSGDTIKIEYFVNGSYTGYELQITVDGIKEEIVYNSNNDTLSYYTNEFDSNNLLIRRHRVKHTGYNGFGYSLDLRWGNIEKYKYDTNHRLVQIDGFEEDKHIYVERFEITEK
jgi:hypothetical protein